LRPRQVTTYSFKRVDLFLKTAAEFWLSGGFCVFGV